jgi:hypothetical protein
VELLSRDQTGGSPNYLAGQDVAQPTWLMLSRTGDTFNAMVSLDGIAWTIVGTATVSMANAVVIGLDVASARRGVWVTARYDNVSVTSGSGSGDTVPLDRSDWTAWASESLSTDAPSQAIDGDITTRFSTGAPQHDSQGFSVSWPVDRTVARIRMDVGSSLFDYPRACGIWITDAERNVTFIDCVPDASGNVDVSFAPLPAQKIEVWQWGTAAAWWSIAEFNAYSPAGGP